MRLETRETLAAIVEEHRPHDVGILRDVLHDDQLAPLERDLALVIQGVRRCGKSTLLRQIAAREDVVDRGDLYQLRRSEAERPPGLSTTRRSGCFS